MAREKRKWEVDDGSTADQKRGGRGAISTPPGLGFFKPKKTGSMSLEIIPFLTTEARNRFADKMRYSSKVGVLYPERTLWVHYSIGINNDSFACLVRNFGKPCPICQDRAKYLDDPDGESQKKADGLKPKQRQLFLVYDNDEPDEGIKLWEVSQYNFGRNLEDYINGVPRADRGPFKQYYHPERGMSLRVTCKEETTGTNSFTDFIVHSMSPRAKPLPEELFDHEFDLDAMVVAPEYATVKRVYLGLDDGDEVGGDEDGDENADSGDGGSGVEPTKPSDNGHAKKPYIFATNDKVQVEFKGETVDGVVAGVDIDQKLANVKLDGRDKPVRFDFSDLTLIEADDTFDLKDAPAGWDKEEEDRTYKPKQGAPLKNAGGGKQPVAAGKKTADEDPTPPKKKK